RAIVKPRSAEVAQKNSSEKLSPVKRSLPESEPQSIQTLSRWKSGLTETSPEAAATAVSNLEKSDWIERIGQPPPGSPIQDESEFAGAAGMLQLALGVAAADETIDDVEIKKTVEGIADAFRLTPEQRESIRLLTRVPRPQYAALKAESAKWAARIPRDK